MASKQDGRTASSMREVEVRMHLLNAVTWGLAESTSETTIDAARTYSQGIVFRLSGADHRS